MDFMIRFKPKKEKQIITTYDLGDIVYTRKAVPTPAYERNKEYRFIIQTRGSIFSRGLKRNKPPKF